MRLNENNVKKAWSKIEDYIEEGLYNSTLYALLDLKNRLDKMDKPDDS